MSKAELVPLKDPLKGMTSVNHSTQNFKGINLNIPLFGEEVSEIGVYGDPTKASAERGEKLFNNLLDYLEEFVRNFESLELPKVPKDAFKS